MDWIRLVDQIQDSAHHQVCGPKKQQQLWSVDEVWMWERWSLLSPFTSLQPVDDGFCQRAHLSRLRTSCRELPTDDTLLRRVQRPSCAARQSLQKAHLSHRLAPPLGLFLVFTGHLLNRTVTCGVCRRCLWAVSPGRLLQRTRSVCVCVVSTMLSSQ